jgi:2-polyprenyl-3-methyl-5-hydroxy-6-metoxy-1,4-benzoquinol methylase
MGSAIGGEPGATTERASGACWACGGPARPASEYWLHGMSSCPRCGLAFGVAGDAAEVHDLYRGDVYFDTYGGGAVSDEPEPLREQEARVRVGVLRRAVPSGKVLEVGAAGGHFLAEARRAGYDVAGIEPTDNGVASARRRFSLELMQGFVEEIDLPPASFDAICAFHVLEHIPEPLATLQRLRGWLRPGGAALFEVPNAISRQARRKGAEWRHLDLAHHVAQFTPAALGALLTRAGFTVESVQSVAYTTYRPATSWTKYASAAVQFAHSGGLPWRPHPSRYELMQAIARR